MNKEIWKDIPGYEGLYQASSLGRIRSMDREVFCKNGQVRFYKGQIRKLTNSTGEDLRVNLSKDGRFQPYTVHRLIMLTFKGERPNDYDICHGNGDYTDNRLENLRYDTRSQNQIDVYRHGSKGTNGKISVEQALEIRRLYATGDYYQRELAEMFKVKVLAICRIINRTTFAWLNDDGTIKE